MARAKPVVRHGTVAAIPRAVIKPLLARVRQAEQANNRSYGRAPETDSEILRNGGLAGAALLIDKGDDLGRPIL